MQRKLNVLYRDCIDLNGMLVYGEKIEGGNIFGAIGTRKGEVYTEASFDRGLVVLDKKGNLYKDIDAVMVIKLLHERTVRILINDRNRLNEIVHLSNNYSWKLMDIVEVITGVRYTPNDKIQRDIFMDDCYVVLNVWIPSNGNRKLICSFVLDGYSVLLVKNDFRVDIKYGCLNYWLEVSKSRNRKIEINGLRETLSGNNVKEIIKEEEKYVSFKYIKDKYSMDIISVEDFNDRIAGM